MATQAIIRQGLCEVCQRISLEILLAAERFEHISDPELLFASTKQCRLCSLIYDSISRVFSLHSTYYWKNPSDSPCFTILRGLEREDFGLDYILVY